MSSNLIPLDRLTGAVRLSASSERLPCKLTDDEWADRADEAAKLHNQILAEEAEEADRRRAFKERIRDLSRDRDRLLREVEDHAEIRMVDVASHGVLDTNELVTIRLDTREVLHRRAMTADERTRAAQSALPLPERPRTIRRPAADESDAEVTAASPTPGGGPIIAGEDAIAMMHGQDPEGLERWPGKRSALEGWTITADGPDNGDDPVDCPERRDAYFNALPELDGLDLHHELTTWRAAPEGTPAREGAIAAIRELLGDDLDSDPATLPPEPGA